MCLSCRMNPCQNDSLSLCSIYRKLAHSKGVGWTERWDFLGCSCDLSLPEGQQLLEEYLREVSSSTTNLNQCSQNVLEDHEDSENPLSEFKNFPLGTPPRSSDTTVPSRTNALNGVSRELFANDDVCENGIETKLASLSVNDKEVDFSEAVDSLADLLEKKLSFHDEEDETDFSRCASNPTPASSSKPIFLAG